MCEDDLVQNAGMTLSFKYKREKQPGLFFPYKFKWERAVYNEVIDINNMRYL